MYSVQTASDHDTMHVKTVSISQVISVIITCNNEAKIEHDRTPNYLISSSVNILSVSVKCVMPCNNFSFELFSLHLLRGKRQSCKISNFNEEFRKLYSVFQQALEFKNI